MNQDTDVERGWGEPQGIVNRAVWLIVVENKIVNANWGQIVQHTKYSAKEFRLYFAGDGKPLKILSKGVSQIWIWQLHARRIRVGSLGRFHSLV